MSGIITNNQKVLIELHVGSEGNFVCDIRFSPPLPKPYPLTIAQKVAAVLATRVKRSISHESFAAEGIKQRDEDEQVSKVRDGDGDAVADQGRGVQPADYQQSSAGETEEGD